MQTAGIEGTGQEFVPPLEKVEELAAASSAQLGAVRLEALKRLRELPALSGSDELWRYTGPDLFDWPSLLEARSLSFSAQGATVADLSAAPMLGRVLGELASDLVQDVATHYQLALVKDAYSITVDGQSKGPIALSSILPEGASAASSLVVITVKSGASASIIEDLASKTFSGLFAPRFEIVVMPNAHCEFVSCQRLAEESSYLARHRFHLFRDATLRSVHLSLGARVSRVDLDCKMYEPGANADLFSLYLAHNEQHTDIHPTQ